MKSLEQELQEQLDLLFDGEINDVSEDILESEAEDLKR
jgi:hypothetical protein